MPGDNDTPSNARRTLLAAVALVVIALAGAWWFTRPAEAPAPATEPSPPQPEATPDASDPLPEIAAAPEPVPVEEPPGEEPLPNDGTIKGVVVDPEGEPIAKAILELYERDLGTQDMTTDNEGRFAFGGLPAMAYTLKAAGKHHNKAEREPIYPSPDDISITLTPRGSIRLTVVAETTGVRFTEFDAAMLDEPPAGDGEWRARARDARIRWRPVKDGAYTFDDIPDDRWHGIAARANGHLPFYALVETVPPGETAEVVIKLKPEMQITGIVLAPDRTPVAGATLYVGAVSRDILARSGPDGRFRITELSINRRTIIADHPNYTPGSAQCNQSTEPQFLEVILNGSGSLEGVVSVKGKPLERVSVNLSRSNFPGYSSNKQTDEFGRYAFEKVPTGIVSLRVMLDSAFNAQFSRKLSLRPGHNIENIELPLLGSRIEGYVTFNENPAPETSVRGQLVNNDNTFSINVRTDRHGFYMAELLPAGIARIGVSLRRGNQEFVRKNFTVEVPLGKSVQYDMELGGSATVSGKVRNWEQAMEGTVEYRSGDRRTESTSGRTRILNNGTFQLEHIPQGDYTLLVFSRDQEIGDGDGDGVYFTSTPIFEANIQLTEGQQLEVNFNLR